MSSRTLCLSPEFYFSNPLFQCHPNLQQLQLSLDTAESVIELFTILQSNTTVKALRVKIEKVDTMGSSLEDMLTLNQKIRSNTTLLGNCYVFPSLYKE